MKEHKYIRKILDGDVSAFSYFVAGYKHMAFTIAFRIVNNREEAEEVVQDAFLKAFKGLSKFRQESKFSTWFYQIVVNGARSKVKSIGPERNDVDIDEVPDGQLDALETACGRMEEEERKGFIHRAMAELKIEDRLLLTLFYLNENSIEEVGVITGIPVENVKMKLHRARRKMFVILSDLLKTEIQYII